MRLSGRVTRQSDGAAIAGAIVTLATPGDWTTTYHVAPVQWVRTDDAGRWSITLSRADRYTVTANASGYVPASREKIRVSPTTEVADIDLTLAEGGVAIEGRVTSSAGVPIDSAVVVARLDRRRELAFATFADASGRYALSLAEGAYLVAVAHPDYASEWQRHTAKESCVRNFSLVPGGVIRGRVVARETREPVIDAIMHVSGLWPTRTDEHGAFEARCLAAGNHALSAHGPGYATRDATRVLITPGDIVDGVELEVEPAFSFVGRIVQKGRPDVGVEDMQIRATASEQRAGLRTATTDARGYFTLVGVLPGDYSLWGIGDGRQFKTDTPVPVRDRDVDDFVYELDVGVTLSGRVEPAAVAVVGLQFDHTEASYDLNHYTRAASARVVTDATGAFSLEGVPDGKFEIIAGTADGHFGKLPIDVAGAAQSGLVVLMTPHSIIRGRVVDTHGKPMAGVPVNCLSPYRHVVTAHFGVNSSYTRSSDDGSFKFTSLEAGDYLLTVNLEDGTYVYVDGTSEVSDVTVVIPARDGVICGEVVDGDGKPVPRAHVIIVREDGRNRPPFNDVGQLTIDDAGRFIIGHTEDGVYTLNAQYPVGGPKGIRHGVQPGDDITITLEPLGSVTFDVVQNGSRVPHAHISCQSYLAMSGYEDQEGVPPLTFHGLAAVEHDCVITAESGKTSFKATVRAGVDTTLVIELPAWSSLTGTVVSATTNEPLADVTVSDRNESTTTDGEGRFVLERVPAGSHTVWFSRPGLRDFEADEYRYTAAPGQRVDMGTIQVVTPARDPGTLGLLVDGALVVKHVQTNGPAAAAGIHVGDTIVSVDGHGLPIAKRLLLGGAVAQGQTVALALASGVTANVVAASLFR